jgi:hypothetical protein
MMMGTDWYEATVEERRLLYRTVKPLVVRGSLSWDELYERAFGSRFSRGIGYESNFATGKIARPKAARIYRWLREHHPGLADQLDRDIAAHNDRDTGAGLWERLLEEHGTFGAIKVIREEPGLPLQQIQQSGPRPGRQEQHQMTRYDPVAARAQQESPQIELGHPFRFRLRTPVTGAVLGVEWVRGRWWPIPLGIHSHIGSVEQRDPYLPPPHGTPGSHGLVEEHEAGLHQVAILVWPEQSARSFVQRITLHDTVAMTVLDDIAKALLALEADEWRVFRLNLMFVPPKGPGGGR